MAKSFRSSTDALLEAMMPHRILYDKDDPGFRNFEMKQQTWQVIADQLGLTADECIRKWNNARDNYVRIRKKVASGESEKFVKWRLYGTVNQMLKSSRQESEADCALETSNLGDIAISVPSTNTNSVDEFMYHDEIEIHEGLGNSQPEVEQHNNTNSGIDHTFLRKRPAPDEDDVDHVDTAMLKTLNVCLKRLRDLEEEKDEWYYHGMSIAARLRRLPQKLRSKTLHQINGILYEAETRAFQVKQEVDA
ncbi:uncharacterized protein LOC135392070 [Ornithodoros turicata]|uniref:uncharacterized protein LOC135392070 n=1 Tax=Ornithodoros turicata TaxID=34597 RepID=UPI00313A1BD5